MPKLTKPTKALVIIAATAVILLFMAMPQSSCVPTVRAVFNADGTSVLVQSTKDLSNVVLKFCDGSADLKYDGLSSKQMTFSGGTKQLAGVWIKSGCNASNDGPGYGEFVGRSCGSVNPTPTPTPSATPTPAPTGSPSYTPTPSPTLDPGHILICHIPDGASANAYTMQIKKNELDAHLSHGDSLGDCPVDCMGLPFGQAKVDLCGVCGGDNSTCKDCAGIPNGAAVVDLCGVCNGDGTSCIGCDGVANSGMVVDACGVCGGDGSTCLDCGGVPGGGKVVDECGVCGGDNSTCKDCAGLPNGASRIDACGTCGGDGSGCDGVPSDCNGQVDSCGVCNGSNSCLDCAGIPNGGTKIDCCGVCGGDGSSCLDLCKFYNLTAQKKGISKSIKVLQSTIVKHSGREGRCSRDRKDEAAARIKAAKKLYSRISSDMRKFLPNRVKICNTPFCSKTSVKSLLSSIRANIKKLYALSKEAQLADIKYCGRSSGGVGSRASEGAFKGADLTLGKLPNVRCDN